MQFATVRQHWARLGHWERVAVAVWSVSLLVVCIRVGLDPIGRSVYPCYADAAHEWRASEDMYRQLRAYRYPPPATLPFIALSYLGDEMANVVWRILSTAVFLIGLAWWSRMLLSRHLTRPELALLALLAVPFVLPSLNNGQANLIMTGFLLIGVAAAQRQRWNLASMCIAAACLLKVYPVAIALLLVAVYPRVLGWRLALALAVGLALPFLLQSPAYAARQYVNWFENVSADDRTGWAIKDGYEDMWMLTRLWGLPLAYRGYQVVQLLTAAGVAGLCVAGRRAGWPRPYLLTTLFNLGCCWMILFGPTTESATYTLLAPTIAWAALEAWISRRSSWVRGTLSLSYTMLLGAFIASWFPNAGTIRGAGPHPLAALILFGVLLVLALLDLRRPIPGWNTTAVSTPQARAA